MQQVDFDYTQKTNSEWKALMWKHLCDAKRFEIHCWKTETEWIDLALNYGELVETSWQWGKIIAGDVTPAFIEMVLELPKPTDTELFNKMTPFFSIFLDDIFCSEHYGTELYQKVKNNK
ncbi:MAG: hypothetical protein IJN87_04880 [Firmicutes bacterium]|nr:hypothetical protein [Bacillota bacterium]